MFYQCLVQNRQIDVGTAEIIKNSASIAVELPDSAFTRVVQADTGCYHIDKASWDALPTWDWVDIMTANGIRIPDVPGLKMSQKIFQNEDKEIGAYATLIGSPVGSSSTSLPLENADGQEQNGNNNATPR